MAHAQGHFLFVFCQMYSFRYDEDETWAVWPRRTSLSAFAHGVGKTVITQIFHGLLDDAKELMNNLKDKVLNEKSLLTTKMNELMTTLESYSRDVETSDDMVR